jgi:hypothetical protein
MWRCDCGVIMTLEDEPTCCYSKEKVGRIVVSEKNLTPEPETPLLADIARNIG